MKKTKERRIDLATRLGLNHSQLRMVGEVVGHAERDEQLRQSREMIVSKVFSLFPGLRDEAKESGNDDYAFLVDKTDSDECLLKAFKTAKKQAESSICLVA